MKTAKIKEWTYEEFMTFPEGGPYRFEIIDGELVQDPFPHPQAPENLRQFLSFHWHLSSFESLGRTLCRPLRRGLFPDPPPGGGAGPGLRLEGPCLHRHREEHPGGSGPSCRGPVSFDGRQRPPGEAGPLRAVRSPRILDRGSPDGDCPGLPSVRRTIRGRHGISKGGHPGFPTPSRPDHPPLRGVPCLMGSPIVRELLPVRIGRRHFGPPARRPDVRASLVPQRPGEEDIFELFRRKSME